MRTDNKINHAFYLQDFTHTSSEKWKELLTYVVDAANVIEFVVKSTKLPDSLKPFEISLIKTFSSRYRWGYQQLSHTTYMRFVLSDELRNFLFERSLGLGQWIGDLPEDPALFQNDQVLMWTISHESHAFIWLSETEAANFNKNGFSLEKTGLFGIFP